MFAQELIDDIKAEDRILQCPWCEEQTLSPSASTRKLLYWLLTLSIRLSEKSLLENHD